MIFFGTLCLWSMAYGVASLFNGIALPIYQPTIKKVGDTINTALETSARTTFRYTEEDGFFKDHFKFRVDTNLEIALALGDREIEKLPLRETFYLTEGENEALKVLIEPLAYFEQYAMILPPNVRDNQRRTILQPILDFLDGIPEVRRISDG